MTEELRGVSDAETGVHSFLQRSQDLNGKLEPRLAARASDTTEVCLATKVCLAAELVTAAPATAWLRL